MQSYDRAWFWRLRHRLADHATPNVPLAEFVDVSHLGLDELAFGYELGVIDTRTAVEVSLQRARNGFLQSEAQLELARLPAADPTGADVTLRTRGRLGFTPEIEALWLYGVLTLFVRRWRASASAEVRVELGEVLEYWTPSLTAPWYELTRDTTSREALGLVRDRLRAEARNYLRPKS